jgi:prolyl oligopeptidase
MAVFAYHDRTPGFERDFVGRSLDFYRRDYFLLMQDGRQKKIDIPADAELDTHREWLLIKTEQRLGGGRQALSVRRAAGGQLR